MNSTREHMQSFQTAFGSDGREVKGQKSNNCSKFVFLANLGEKYYDIPYVYYKGYAAYTESGQRLEITQIDSNGLIRVFMPANTSGIEQVTVKYIGTKYQKLSYLLLAVGIVTFVGLYISKRKKMNSSRE